MPVERIQQDVNFQSDLTEISNLQSVFDSNSKQKATSKILSYNPVLERWKFEQIVYETDEIKFRRHEEQQMKTALGERLNASRSSVNYKIYEGKAYNEYFPDESFDNVLKRGIAYRKSLGSKEIERENLELDGWQTVFDKLLDSNVPDGSKYIVISGPGLVEQTSYPHNFVDIYEKAKNDSGEVIVRMTRSASKNNYADYQKIALDQDPTYFDGMNVPIDAWLLSHPIRVSQDKNNICAGDIFRKMFDKNDNSIDTKTYEKILEKCMPLILNYIDILCGNIFNPNQIKIAFNAVLNKADIEKQIIEGVGENASQVRPQVIFRNIKEEAYYLGTKQVREIMAGCGLSAGYNTDPTNNSVSQFADKGPDGLGPLNVICPICGTENKRPVGGYVYKCQNENCSNPTYIACGKTA